MSYCLNNSLADSFSGPSWDFDKESKCVSEPVCITENANIFDGELDHFLFLDRKIKLKVKVLFLQKI